MKRYAVGFAFDEDSDQVVLIRKNRPRWQVGLLNGIGGHIEAQESPVEAMCREFREETGVYIGQWVEFAVLSGADPDGDPRVVHCFRANSLNTPHARTMTEEEVMVVPVIAVLVGQLDVVPNLLWLIPMALARSSEPEWPYRIEGTRVAR